MPRPLIGVSTYFAEASWSVWQQQSAVLLPVQYPRLVQESGGIAALLPPDDPAVADEAVARLDALVISGGPDVDPARYGEQPGPHTDHPPTARDAWELALLTAALRRGLPLLGICRGMQLLNVALGGDLTQHLPDLVGHDGHSPSYGAYASHPVTPTPGTRLAGVLGEAALDVPTYHHQAVRRLGDGLVPCARALDGTTEAVELPGGFALGVQWHPEQGTDLRLTRALVQAAGAGPGAARPEAAQAQATPAQAQATAAVHA
ncbi:gamma-glutamyl-gamma-aminobutyrate hydrolase family protein [Streptacidiphilus sp. PB12-B1b]|uniref:gamma-glutamyl-gamma-aminobutyrate hydrolase family protein n=1 Tax=Streptacidiphilus sp. PB12-B1b TaxID=2705012 RepID=UPI0015F88472|nr:gamma-glutamyl-gamma-aminobutyrate hydrolase family protein [Streptacidiphilus sp. PB12-B1b]QMU76334.1 gamma-glutamyl-gamma-aminobutyrate hydrolase family protein [Streptacidiphilus sp. PB12-B1b]